MYIVFFLLGLTIMVLCSNEYPLFIPRQNYCSTSGDNSWTNRRSSNFVVASMEYEREPRLDSCGSNSFNSPSASPHSVETHKDLQKGISLLKKSVSCITSYCYNSLCLDVPTEVSTFKAFSKLLATPVLIQGNPICVFPENGLFKVHVPISIVENQTCHTPHDDLLVYSIIFRSIPYCKGSALCFIFWFSGHQSKFNN